MFCLVFVCVVLGENRKKKINKTLKRLSCGVEGKRFKSFAYGAHALHTGETIETMNKTPYVEKASYYECAICSILITNSIKLV